ncbi:MAG: metallophosphoesterase family protein [Verrucomicrobiota bacterium]
MRYAVFSDIHGNLPALQAVLRDAEGNGCEGYLCAGDIVGEYDWSNECVELVRSIGAVCVKGNQDEYCASGMALDGFNEKARERVRATREALSERAKEWLIKLPLVVDGNEFTLVHGSLDHPERWGYVFDKSAAAASFMGQKSAVCFNGHTHVPVCFEKDQSVRGGTYTQVDFRRGTKYLVNVGSVGQSRDGVVKSSYVIYDADEKTAELRRIDFMRPGGGAASAPVAQPR